jgi:hypothetical protein
MAPPLMGAQLHGDEITFLGAWDTLGKIHKVSRGELRTLQKQLKQLP